MTTNDIRELHGVEFRRNPEWQSGWEFYGLSGDWVGIERLHLPHKALVGVLEERFPTPRTVMAQGVEHQRIDGDWTCLQTGDDDLDEHAARALDQLDRIQNGDPDAK